MSTFHCKRCGRAIFRAADILEKVNLWDLGEYQAECYALSRAIDLDGLTRYDASLHEGWYCCRFIVMRMVVDKFGTGDKLLVYADSVMEVPEGQAPRREVEDKGQIRLTAHDFHRVLTAPSNWDKLLVVKFGAIWCPPCRLMDQVIGRISRSGRLPDVRFFEVDIDEEHALAERWDVQSIPFIAAFHRGQQLPFPGGRGAHVMDGALVGGVSEARLVSLCVQALEAARSGASAFAG